MIDILIIAYKDEELLNTINDVFEKATNPDNLNVIVITQMMDFKDDRCKVYNFNENKGLGFCREFGYRLCENEYYLQLPAHSRMIPGWDDELIVEDNEILVSPTMNYDLDGNFDDKALLIQINKLDNKVIMQPYGIHYKKEFEGKETALLTGVLFSKGMWIKDVPFDNRIFVQGDEIDMSVRSFNAGYKFKIMKPISYHLWHNKENSGRPKWNKADDRDKAMMQILKAKIVGIETKYPWKDFDKYKQLVEETKI